MTNHKGESVNKFIACIICLFLQGCVSVGTKTDQNVVNTFKPGVTTLAEVKAKLGDPNQTTQNADGSTLIQYIYATGHANGASYIPVVGLFAGKSIVDNVTRNLTFDKAGRFVSATTSYGHTEAGLMGSATQ